MTRQITSRRYLLLIIFLTQFISTYSYAEGSIGNNLAQGFVKYQAGRIENIALENVIDKIRYRFSFQILFPLTSNAMQEYVGISSKRLIPMMQYYIKKDIENFEIFSMCIITQLESSDQNRSFSEIYQEVKSHFTKSTNWLEPAYENSVANYMKKMVEADRCTDNILPGEYKISLDDLVKKLEASILTQENGFLPGLFNSWITDVKSNQDIISVIKASKNKPEILNSFTENVIKNDTSYFSWLIDYHQISDRIEPLKFEKLTAANLKVYNFISKLDIDNDVFKDNYNAGNAVLGQFLDNKKNLRSVKDICISGDNTSRTCQIVSLIFRIKSLSEITHDAKLNTVKIHKFLMTVKTFDIEEQYESDKSTFRSHAMFLADLLDAAEMANKDNASDAVAKTIAAFIDEGQVYLDKRKRKYCGINNFCWFKNSILVSSYFGISGILSEHDNLESRAKVYGPVGFEYKIMSNRVGILGINCSPLDFGNAISQELQGNNVEDDISSMIKPSVFLALTLRQAPVSFILGHQRNVKNKDGDEFNINFASIVLDLPLVTIY